MQLIVAGIGTNVGKTVVSAILATQLQSDYWKPIESGTEEESDTATMTQWLDPKKQRVYLPAYSFKASLSPHHAALLENRVIQKIPAPVINRPLVIEMAGGIFTPLTTTTTSLDLFKTWKAKWIIVSRHYLGSINHTLLTLEVLRQNQVCIAGVIFNGTPNPDSEEAILKISKLPLIARVFPEKEIHRDTIQRYARQWNLKL